MAGLQLGGLVSGMDTSTIISQLLEADTQKLKTKQTQIDKINKQKSMWTDIKLKLMDLKYAAKDLALTTTFMTKEASSSDSNIVTAKSEAGSSNATYTLKDVTLAVAGKVTGTAVTMSNGTKGKIEGNSTWNTDSGYTGNVATAIGNRRFSDYSSLGLNYGTVNINGAAITVNSTDTLNLVATKINASTANVKATVDTNGKLSIEAKTEGATITIDPGESNFFTKFGIDGGAYTKPVTSDYLRTFGEIDADATASSDLKAITPGFFTLNGFTFEVKDTESVSSMIKQINSSEAGVNAVYDSTKKQFTFSAKEAGKSVTMENDTSNFLHKLGVMTNDTTQTYTGTGSKYNLNGISMEGETNDIVIDGTTMTLKSATDTGEVATVTVTNKSDKAVEKIKDFVDKYNKIIDLIEENSKVEVEDKTDENIQNSTKYKNSTVSKGILNGDGTANQILYSLRRTLTEKVSNVESGYDQLASIGITAADSKSSHLTLDETALKEALDKNPDEVFKLFSNSGKEKTKTVGYSTGSAANISTTSVINLGNSYSGTDSTAIENRIFGDFSSSVTSGTMKINGKSIYVARTDSISSMVTKINSAGAGVTASFTSGKLNITANNTNENITLGAGTTNFLYRTGILQETSQYDGITARLENYVNPMTKYQGTLDGKKDYYANRIEDITTWMTNYSKRMEDKQNRYVKQFAAMEKAMSTANSQSSWLSSQLSSLG